MLLAFSDATNKKDYTQLDEDIKERMLGYFKQEQGYSELKNNIFQILDKRLATFKTQFQARVYQKVITAIQKCTVLDINEINVLFLKAKRFLSKENVKKEKLKIKNEIKSNFIALGKASIDNEKGVYVNAKGDLKQETDSDGDFEDIDDDDESEIDENVPVAHQHHELV